MPDTPDKTDTRADSTAEPTADELLVLDLLYGELDDVEASAAREKVGASASASEDLQSLSGVRALFAQLADEEPPAASTARLLHAAAAAVPSSRGLAPTTRLSPGLWSRFVEWFRPLMGNPAFAAATMLVVVAGVAGALYLSGDGGNAQPTVASQSEAPPSSSVDDVAGEEPKRAAASPSAPALEDLTRDVDIAPGPNSDDDNAIGEKPAANGAIGAGRGARTSPLPGRFAEKKGAGGDIDKLEAPAAAKALEGTTSRQGRNKKSNRAPSSEPQSNVPRTQETDPRAVQRRVETARPASKPAPRKPKRSRSTTVSGTAGNSPMVDSEEAIADEADSSPADSGADKSKTQRGDAARGARDVRDLHKRALQAARDGECEAVRSLGTRIRGLDSRYFASSFARDARLQTCLGTANTEKTRSKARAKQ